MADLIAANSALRRRDFLKGLVALPLIAAGTSGAWAVPTRPPYVVAGEIVDNIVWHRWDLPAAPTGPVWVHEVLPWDGVGYPIIIKTIDWRQTKFYRGWYDHEWVNFQREIPGRFWADHGNKIRYPNVHSYIREVRFGEHPSVMRQTMERNHQLGPSAFNRPLRLPFEIIEAAR